MPGIVPTTRGRTRSPTCPPASDSDVGDRVGPSRTTRCWRGVPAPGGDRLPLRDDSDGSPLVHHDLRSGTGRRAATGALVGDDPSTGQQFATPDAPRLFAFERVG